MFLGIFLIIVLILLYLIFCAWLLIGRPISTMLYSLGALLVLIAGFDIHVSSFSAPSTAEMIGGFVGSLILIHLGGVVFSPILWVPTLLMFFAFSKAVEMIERR